MDLRFVWLEITGNCQLNCIHCYADSGPAGTHGSTSTDNWCQVIDECAALGVGMVQFIGGEPTRHPDLPRLIGHALAAGIEVEVFSNLVHISPAMWETLDQRGVRLACSYYSDHPAQHAQITGRNTLTQTRKNIAEAVRRSIPLRVGLIEMLDDQRTEAAVDELRALGVREIGTDRLRQVGRGVRDLQASPDQLCGRCADGVLAISTSGQVWPCVFSRWMPVGNVLTQPLRAILSGPATRRARAELTEHFRERACAPRCHPDCNPKPCQPSCPPNCSPGCAPPCKPSSCWPYYE